MGNAQKIRMALAYKGMSESEPAKALGKTPQAFNQVSQKITKKGSDTHASITTTVENNHPGAV